ncbi:glycosyltransferase family 2 protein [Flavobacterium columnare]|uniref:Glycosyltransferase n=1 Tax=Flavobacterium columnare TaxID=996 RepID=A0AAI8GC42_9FLAO|nr:glycosyltransferase [Flavobacterium columnare]AMO21160.1 glycosyltransferase [Flavobacterium columnare]AUX19181.1 hypothetical protein AQ623_13470 [Flavobacterium columnare]QOG58258.1 glycosyltransferase [Flavobacterium columnare]QOG60981.1 glycosyltransferase [Flavobacterium columnare]QOG63701.1 glycosyltransferase [Flavobacterium columnare]
MISIVIPTYNSQRTIRKALLSVIEQSYQNWELIVVDDGSIDRTIVEVNNLINTLPDHVKKKIKLIQQANTGPSGARNKGIKNAKGRFIAFLDADDYWFKDKLEIQYRHFADDSDLILCATAFGHKKLADPMVLKIISFKKLLFKNYFSTPAVMIKKEALREVSFDENQRFSEDYKLWLSIAFDNKCLYINEVLAANQDHKSDYGQYGLSANLFQMEKGELSNYIDLFEKGKINFTLLLLCVSFSIVKYMKRIIVSLLQKKF